MSIEAPPVETEPAASNTNLAEDDSAGQDEAVAQADVTTPALALTEESTPESETIGPDEDTPAVPITSPQVEPQPQPISSELAPLPGVSFFDDLLEQVSGD